MIEIELLQGGQVPQRVTAGANAYDVFARDIKILDDHRADIYLGFKIDTSDSIVSGGLGVMAAFLMPRSGWGSKYNFRMRNTIGLIDSDFRHEVEMRVAYDEMPPELFNIEDQPRVGQIAIMPTYVGPLEVVNRLGDSEREGGFGSTDS